MGEIWHDCTPEGAAWEEQVSSAGNWRSRPRPVPATSPEAVVNVEWQAGRAPRRGVPLPPARHTAVLPYPRPDAADEA